VCKLILMGTRIELSCCRIRKRLQIIMIGVVIMAKLGDNKKPAIVRVATEERALEIYALCENNGWKVVIGIEPDKVRGYFGCAEAAGHES
jgi:hypothetical protein